MKEPNNLHTKRMKFAWFPVRRWVAYGERNQWRTPKGFYWLREIWQVRAGLLNEWTAYASHND